MENPPLKLKTARVLGQGAFATVHKALHNSSVVAVKVLRPEFVSNKAVVRMLLREAALVSSLTHPHIVRYRALCQVAVGAGPPSQALVMEYMESGSLADLLSKQMRQPRELLYSDAEGLMWMQQIADALSYLHRREPAIIHRDVKPANVLLAPATSSASTRANSKSMLGGRGLSLSLGLSGVMGGGSRALPGPRLVAKLCDFGLHQVVKPADHRPLIRVSSMVARASSSGVFHHPRVSEDGSLVLPVSLLRTCERLRRPPTANAAAAASGGAAAAATSNDVDGGPMGQCCPFRQLDSAVLSVDGDSLGHDAMRRLTVPMGLMSSLVFTDSAVLETQAAAAIPLPPSQRLSGGFRVAEGGGGAAATTATVAYKLFSRTSSAGAASATAATAAAAAVHRQPRASASVTAAGMTTTSPSPFTTSVTLGFSPPHVEVEARAASLPYAQPLPPKSLSPGPRRGTAQRGPGRTTEDDGLGDGGGCDTFADGTGGGEQGGGGGGGGGLIARHQSRLQQPCRAPECGSPPAAAPPPPVPACKSLIDSPMGRLQGWFTNQLSSITGVGPKQDPESGSFHVTFHDDGAVGVHGVAAAASPLPGSGRQAGGGGAVPFCRTSTAPRDGGSGGGGHVPIGQQRRSYSFAVGGGLSLGLGTGGGNVGGAAVGTAVPNAISADAGLETPVLERVFKFSGQCGSSIYMSPEVAQEQPYNEKADVFSFGVMLFEVLSRKLIAKTHEGRDGYAFTRMMVEGRRPLLPPGVDPRVGGLIGACWHSDPLERPAMQQVVAALQDVLHGDVAAAGASPRAAFARVMSSTASAGLASGGGNVIFREDPSGTIRQGSSVAFASRQGGGAAAGGAGAGDTAAGNDVQSLRTYDNPLSSELSISLSRSKPQVRLLSLMSTAIPTATTATNPTTNGAAAVDVLSTFDASNGASPAGGFGGAAAIDLGDGIRAATGGRRPEMQQQRKLVPPTQHHRPPPPSLEHHRSITLARTFASPFDVDGGPECSFEVEDGGLQDGPREPSRQLSARGFGGAVPTHGSPACASRPHTTIHEPGPGRAAPDRRAAAAAAILAAAAARGAVDGAVPAATAIAARVTESIPEPSDAVCGINGAVGISAADDGAVAPSPPATYFGGTNGAAVTAAAVTAAIAEQPGAGARPGSRTSVTTPNDGLSPPSVAARLPQPRQWHSSRATAVPLAMAAEPELASAAGARTLATTPPGGGGQGMQPAPGETRAAGPGAPRRVQPSCCVIC